MKVKKIAALIIMSVMLLTLSACASGRRVIPLSRLEFGMTKEQVNDLMDSEPDMSGDGYDVYLDRSSDLDARLNSCIFNYNGAGRLYAFFIESDCLEKNEAEAMQKDIMDKLDALYSFSDEDWLLNDTQSGYSRVDFDQKLAVMVRVNTDEDGSAVSVTIMSDIHSEDENAENISVIPKK